MTDNEPSHTHVDPLGRLSSTRRSLARRRKPSKRTKQSSTSPPLFIEENNTELGGLLIEENSTELDGLKSSNSEAPIETYPPDCYTFMALHGPLDKSMYFYFGLMVWALQVTFFLLLVLRVASPTLSTNEDTDNPEESFFANFVPSNVGALSRGTQFMALISYCIFADESLKDVVTAVQMWPMISKAKPEDKLGLLVTSSILRFLQGFMATVVVFLLVISTADVVEIVLNFTAVNFVSAFDDVAFELARWGKYGPGMEAEAKRIEDLPRPECLRRSTHHIQFWAVILPMASALIASLTIITIRQDSFDHWLTGTLRVQFKDGSNLEPYSGCYIMDRNSKMNRFQNKRMNYLGSGAIPGSARFGYCGRLRKWILYEGNSTDACTVEKEKQLAKSDRTYDFDISSSFDSAWYSGSGMSLEMYFFDQEKLLTAEQCGSFLGDGNCNTIFNRPEYGFDQGDCCAATCNGLQCGMGNMKTVFGTEIRAGDGYPECLDTTMTPITILLRDIYLTKNEQLLSGSNSRFFVAEPVPPLMTIDCDGENILMTYLHPDMANKTETIKVASRAICKVKLRSRSIALSNLWHVNYTIFHGDADSITSDPIVILEVDNTKNETVSFQRIDDCYLEKLKEHINKTNIYTVQDASNKAIGWLMEDTSGFSNCESPDFIERYALAAVNFAAPLNSSAAFTDEEYGNDAYNEGLGITTERHCNWVMVACFDGSVVDLTFDYGGRRSGTLATEIGLLRNLKTIEMSAQGIYGSIPSEIGLLSDLRVLVMTNNFLTGTIPTEIGKLTRLQRLSLDMNGDFLSQVQVGISGTLPKEIQSLTSLMILSLHGNSITGSIPSEIGKLSNLTGFTLYINSLTGTIPTEIGELQELQQLSLAYNLLTGTIPSELGSVLSDNLYLDLQVNNLTGSVPLELLANVTNKTVEVHGNKLSDLTPVDGSQVCSNNEVQFSIGYSINGGEHYCNCRNDCFEQPPHRPNKCTCEGGQACCNSLRSQIPECIICEAGLSNPDHRPDSSSNELRLTCGELVKVDFIQLLVYTGESPCNETKQFFVEEFECFCNEDNSTDTIGELILN